MSTMDNSETHRQHWTKKKNTTMHKTEKISSTDHTEQKTGGEHRFS
jgi:hypothetical protein